MTIDKWGCMRVNDSKAFYNTNKVLWKQSELKDILFGESNRSRSDGWRYVSFILTFLMRDLTSLDKSIIIDTTIDSNDHHNQL